ncbi:MAG: SIR2 family protein [Afipia sp.]|nr:SIR2 family protein [Afipia sp.]
MTMNLPENWKSRDNLIQHLADQLVQGRLGIFLGAGVSSFYGLPEWRELVDRISIACGDSKLDPSDDPIVRVGALRATHFRNDVPGFLSAVKRQLYDNLSLDFEQIRKNDTLAAIGSLVMSSKRGSAAKVISLNYDDLLENYLEFHGFVTTPVWKLAHWANTSDVTVYHPHGFLPLAPDRSDSEDIVLGTQQYHDVMTSKWRPLLESFLRTHTFLYIGLSGSDVHLQSLVHGISQVHAITNERICYHTVRFSRSGQRDDIGATLEPLGVFTHGIKDYSELPKLLFAISQAARKARALTI